MDTGNKPRVLSPSLEQLDSPGRVIANLLQNGASLQDKPASTEKISAVLMLLLFTGAFTNLRTSYDTQLLEPAAGMLILQLTSVAIYGLALVLLLRYCHGFLKMILRERSFVILAVLPLLSVMWSDAPSISFRRGIALIGTSLLGAYLAFRYEVREQLKLLGWVLGIAVLFSYIFHFAGLGTPVTDIYGEAWYGVFTHKNELGRMMVLSTIVFLVLLEVLPRHRWVMLAGMAFSAALVVFSSSVTSLLILMILLSLFPFIRGLRCGAKRAVLALVTGGVLAIGASWWVMSDFGSVLDLLGKDATLTGRVDLWVVAGAKALERPWLGYGYNAFWLGLDGPSAEIWRVVGWIVDHGHNGLLDLWLELGLLGVALFLFGFIVYSKRALVLIRKWHRPEALWPIMFLAYLFLSNLTESSFLQRNSIFWVLYTATVLNVSGYRHRSAIPMRVLEGRGRFA